MTLGHPDRAAAQPAAAQPAAAQPAAAQPAATRTMAADPVEADPVAPRPVEAETTPVRRAFTAEDRRAAFAAGTPRMSPRVIARGIAALLVLGVGGALADHFVTSSTPAPATSHRSPTGHSGPVLPDHASTTPARTELHAPLAAFMGLTALKGTAAVGFTLTDAATGARLSLASLAGHVVVLSFANARCNDICPVLSQELARADAELGTTKVPVTFVTVNTDPLALDPKDAAILSRTPLGELHNYRFLTGSIKALNPVWTTYGISITAERSTGAVSHNELLYFITPAGTIAWAATPFANESGTGTYTLPAAEITRFAAGIAHYARKLADA